MRQSEPARQQRPALHTDALHDTPRALQMKRGLAASPYASQVAMLKPARPVFGAPVQMSADDGGARATQTAYRAWLQARLAEVAGLEGSARVQRVQGLLWLTEDVACRLRDGQAVQVDALPTAPRLGAPQACGGIPPEWIEVVRQLIDQVERPVEGATASDGAQVEGSLYSGTDWNSRLGVAQYRTQSDNLASPEATCNGTSFAMAIERLGVSRADVVNACERAMGLTDESTDTQRAERWQQRVGAWMRVENSRSYNYQKLRGQAQSGATRARWSGEFKTNAQMEDVVLFLAYLKGISRTSITSNPGNIRTLLTAIDGDSAGNIATVQKMTSFGSWDNLRTRTRTCLEGGGAVIFSFYHKGSKASERNKTHIITVQHVEDDGFIVDDPYGRMREDYSHREYGDAYAAAGSMRRTTKNTVDRSDANDWQVDNAQSPTANETRGRSYKVTRKTIEESFYYVELLSRPQETGS